MPSASPTVTRAKTWINLRNDRSISELMQHNVSDTPPDKIIYEDTLTGKTATYGGFREQVMRSAFWLKHDFDFQPGQTVTIISPSCIDYLVVVHAVWWVGGIVSAINNALNASEIQHGIDLIKPDIVVTHDSVLEKLEAIIHDKDRRYPYQFLTLGKRVPNISYFPTEMADTWEAKVLEPFSLSEQDSSQVCASIVLSSGTTGSPKAVMLSHYNLVSTCEQLRADNPDNWRGSQNEIFFPPLSHIYGIYVCATMCCWLGAYVCMLPRFDIDIYCRLMQDRKATLARLVPPIAKLLAESPVVQKYTYPSLEYFSCSAAPLKAKLAATLSAKFPGVVLAQTYGCTELSGPIVQSGVRDRAMQQAATGTPIANIEMCFVDEHERSSATGPGEISIRGPNRMMGYKDNPDAGADAMMADGWYKTGDLGFLDPDGYLMLYDRTKDIIKYKGFQVSPGEVEDVLFKHSSIFDAAVVGIWSEDESTELPRAFVVLKDGSVSKESQESILSALHGLVSKQLSNYKQLRGGIVFMESLPRNPTGKILRKELRSSAGPSRGTPVRAKL